MDDSTRNTLTEKQANIYDERVYHAHHRLLIGYYVRCVFGDSKCHEANYERDVFYLDIAFTFHKLVH